MQSLSSIKVGDDVITELYLGDSAVTAAYLGNILVWQAPSAGE